MPTPTQLLDGVMAGTVSLDDVRRWVESVQGLYIRPDIAGIRAGDRDQLDAFVDRYSDWEVREADLARALRHALDGSEQQDDAAPERSVLVLQAAEILAGLHPQRTNVGVLAFVVGHRLWAQGKPGEAVSYLVSVQPLGLLVSVAGLGS